MRSILLILVFNAVNIVFSLDQVLADQQTDSSSRQINVDKYGNLSIEIKQAPLIDVVHEIKRQTNIKFKIQPKGNPKLTCRFGNLPLKQGLKKLFANFNYVFIHEDAKLHRPRVVIESIILLNDKLMSETNIQDKNNTAPLISSISNSDLASPDPNAPQEVIRDMEETEIQTDLSDITTTLTSDPDEDIRVEAVQALASQESEKRVSILFQALDDESVKVRNQVITTLGVIDTKAASEAFRTAVDNHEQN